jgi:hypothetical protein
LKILELFSGTASFSNVAKERMRGSEVKDKFNITQEASIFFSWIHSPIRMFKWKRLQKRKSYEK